MTTPRAHADLATLYFSDAEMMCWGWEEREDGYHWWYLPNPSFIPGRIYHVGKIAPTEPPQIMCELAGINFPAPIPEKNLQETESYYFLQIRGIKSRAENYKDEVFYEEEIILPETFAYPTEEACITNAMALIAANQQAIEKAKEQMK